MATSGTLPTNPVPIRYPLDLTGRSINNLISDEPHALNVKAVRSIAPTYGPYYTQSLVVTDATTARVLTRGVDYVCLDVVGLRSAQSGEEVCTIVAVTNRLVSNTVRISYQCVGGYYLGDYEPIRLLIENLSNDTRQVQWENIVNRPETFDPQKHLHRLGDVIGFEYVVMALENIRNAIILGDDVSHASIINQLDLSIQGLSTLLLNANATNTAVALANATDANNASGLALRTIQSTQVETGTIEDHANAALVKSSQLLTSMAQAETQAKALLENYPAIFLAQTNSNLADKPPTSPSRPMLFTGSEAIGFITSDYYAIDNTGKVIVGTESEGSSTALSNLVFTIRATSYKDVLDGQAVLTIQMNTLDQRNSALQGSYADLCQVTVFPAMLDDGAGNLAPIYASEASYVCTENPVDRLTRGVLYGVIGVDAGTNLNLKQMPEINAATANRIASYLFDFRCDYNVSGYGNSGGRAGVKFLLPIGTEFGITLKFSGISVEDLRKYLVLNFKQGLRVMNSTGAATNPVLVKDNPDYNKIRALSVYY
jgi:hypothetical protein